MEIYKKVKPVDSLAYVGLFHGVTSQALYDF